MRHLDEPRSRALPSVERDFRREAHVRAAGVTYLCLAAAFAVGTVIRVVFGDGLPASLFWALVFGGVGAAAGLGLLRLQGSGKTFALVFDGLMLLAFALVLAMGPGGTFRLVAAGLGLVIAAVLGVATIPL